MATRQRILFLLTAALCFLLAACGGGSTANVKNPPPLPSTNVCITLQGGQCPATSAATYSMFVNGTLSLSATVTNDPNNLGVDWTATCAFGSICSTAGTLSALHTASGQAVTYTPPPAFTGNMQNVNVVAYATADHAQNVVAAVTITAFGNKLQGNYVLQAQGLDSSLNLYQFAGVIYLDGKGNVAVPPNQKAKAAGEQTVNFVDPVSGAFVSKTDTITGGSYFLGADGRGTITINTPNTTNNIPDTDIGPETFSFVMLSGAQALITAQPTPTLTISASGTMDLQSSIATPSRGFAFVVRGTDFNTGFPSAMGGVLNIDSLSGNPNNISGSGSVADQVGDTVQGGSLIQNQPISGTISSPDSFGQVILNLTSPNFTNPSFQFTGYMVDAAHIKLIESDNISGAGVGSTAGVAVGQGSATGSFQDGTSFAGTYVSGVLGMDLTAGSTTMPTLTSAAVFTAQGSAGVTTGNIANGFTDTFLQQNGAQGTAGAQISAAFSGTYSMFPKGTGRLRAFFIPFVPPPHPMFEPELFFYLTGNGNPPLVLWVGDGVNNYPALGTGIAYPQSGPLTFNGDYGFSFTQGQSGSESDGTGQFAADASTGTSSAVVDVAGQVPATISGTFQPPLSNGRFGGTLFESVNVQTAGEYYIIDASHGFFVETDLLSLGTGTVSLGYYAARTPVCTGCP